MVGRGSPDYEAAPFLQQVFGRHPMILRSLQVAYKMEQVCELLLAERRLRGSSLGARCIRLAGQGDRSRLFHRDGRGRRRTKYCPL